MDRFDSSWLTKTFWFVAWPITYAKQHRRNSLRYPDLLSDFCLRLWQATLSLNFRHRGIGLGPRTSLEKPNPSREPGFVELLCIFGCTNSLTLNARWPLDPRLLGRTGSVQCLLLFRADRVYRKVRPGSHPRSFSPSWTCTTAKTLHVICLSLNATRRHEISCSGSRTRRSIGGFISHTSILFWLSGRFPCFARVALWWCDSSATTCVPGHAR